MNFVEKMREAMQMMVEACAMNTEWRGCIDCPFRDYCDVLELAEAKTPADEDFIGE